MLGGGMHLSSFVALLLLTLHGSDGAVERVASVECDNENTIEGNIYNYTLPDLLNVRNISLSDFQGKQEPGANGTEIFNGIQHVRPGNNFVPNFQLFKKIDVNGEKEHPLFTFLKKHCRSTRDGFAGKDYLYYSPVKVNDIRWNWEKFLVNKNGKPVKRYDPSTHPENIRADIEELLAQDSGNSQQIQQLQQTQTQQRRRRPSG
ncbi:hypothetical protein C0J52_11984 [Blattella germanica]|nr:hypothetical protein C0J52_11984 [Blattella germanica]